MKKLKPGVILPNLITMGNGVCGFAAIVKLMKIQVVAADGTGGLAFDHSELFVTAAWLILLGMVFDVFDGQVARLSGKTSDLGAQLDSFCDLVTFGLAPAFLVVRLNMVYAQLSYGEFWQKFAWCCCLAYFLGAMLRLARFNEENEHDSGAHLCFKGLPSPAAAGCVASIVLFYYYIMDFKERELLFLSQYIPREALQESVRWIPFALPILTIFLGWAMVAGGLRFDHLASRVFNRSQSFNVFVYLIFGSILVFVVPEVLLPMIFYGYLLFTPCRVVIEWYTGRRSASLVAEGPEQGHGGG